nr:flagellar biosynthetic protein FliO [Virgibacillus profundi]
MIKRFLSICIIGLFLITFTIQVEAESVDDWLKDEDHEDKDNGTTPNEPESSENDTQANVGSNGSLLFDLIKMFFALLLILALIYLLLKFLGKRNKLFQQIKALENLGGVSVGQNKSIQIIRLGNSFYLIGVGENVEMLQEITDEEVIKDLLDRDGDTDTYNAGALVTSLFQRKANGENNSNDQSKKDFKNLFSSELDKLKANRTKLINQQKQKEDKYE